MANQDKHLMRKRLVNAYLSSVISISLVLLLIGTASLLIVNARSVADYFKENLQMSVLLKPEASQTQADKYLESVQTLPFVKTARLVTKEEGTEELKALLGEDFLSVFESSPIPFSIDVTLSAEYVAPDSLEFVSSVLGRNPIVDEIETQQNLVEALNANLAKISLVLAVFILLMLFVSFVLINNTVRLNVFARRFTIHTMKLVGATKPFIIKPFLARSVIQGLVSSGLSLLILGGLLFFIKRSFEQLFEIFTPGLLFLVCLIVIVCGVVLCVVSTYFVVSKLLKLSKDDLYY